MEEGDAPETVGSSAFNSPNIESFRWFPDFTWVKFDRVNSREKLAREPDTKNTELIVNDLIQDSDYEASVSPVIPHQSVLVSRGEVDNFISKDDLGLFQHGKDGYGENNAYSDNGEYDKKGDLDKKIGIHEVEDGDDESCSATSEILLSINDLQHGTVLGTAYAKGMPHGLCPSLNSGEKEEVINTMSMELFDSCTGSTQDEPNSDWKITTTQKEADDMSVVTNGAGPFTKFSHVVTVGETLRMPIEAESDVGPTAVVNNADTFKGRVAMENDVASLTAVLDDTKSLKGPVAIADDAETSSRPVALLDGLESGERPSAMINDVEMSAETVSGDGKSVEPVAMEDDTDTFERLVAIVNDNEVLDDSKYVHWVYAIANDAETSAQVITLADDDKGDKPDPKFADVEFDVESSVHPGAVTSEMESFQESVAAAHNDESLEILAEKRVESAEQVAACAAESAEKDSQHASEQSRFLMSKTAEDTKMDTGHHGLLYEKLTSGFVAMELQTSAEREASNLEDLEMQRTDRSINDNHRKEIDQLRKAEQHLFTAQQSLENDFQENSSVCERLHDVQKILLELHASQSLETQSIARKMELPGKNKSVRSLLLYEGKLLRIRRRKLVGLSETCQQLHEKVLSSSTQLEAESDDRIVHNYSFSNAWKPHKVVNALTEETIIDRNSSLKKSSRETKFFEASSNRKTVRFTLPESESIANQARKFNVREKETAFIATGASQQSQKISYGSTSLLQSDNGHQFVPADSLMQNSCNALISGSVRESQNQTVNSYNNYNKKANDNFSLKRSNDLVPAVTPSKVSKPPGSENNALQAKLHTFRKEFSENNTAITDVDVNPGAAEEVLNSIPSRSGTISEVNSCTATSRAKFTSNSSGISSANKLPMSVATASANTQFAAPQLYVHQFTAAPCLLSTCTVAKTSELHSQTTSCVVSCPLSEAATWNYQQAGSKCRIISKPKALHTFEQTLRLPLSATSNMLQIPVTQVPATTQKALQNGHLDGQIVNVKDRHKTGSAAEELVTQDGCPLFSQGRNFSSKISLKHLITDKLIQPGVNVLSARSKTGQVFASITPSGHIKNDRGQIFKSLRAWYLDAVELDAASLATVHRQVLYYGVPVETIASGFKHMENSSQVPKEHKHQQRKMRRSCYRKSWLFPLSIFTVKLSWNHVISGFGLVTSPPTLLHGLRPLISGSIKTHLCQTTGKALQSTRMTHIFIK